MSKGTIFWMIMILWIIFGLVVPAFRHGYTYLTIGGDLLEFALFFLLGWHCFGFIVKD